MVYPPGVYLKSPDEMREMFPEVPEACDNTLAIAARCNVEIDLKTRHAPGYRPPDGTTPEDYLRRLCYEGAKERYGEITDRVKERMERELQVIQSKGFSSYFLIVWDFCNYARSQNIPVGARGSGVGTMVGYCLGLCNVDPLQYDLLFERFMDPSRNEMPDIDIDICQDGRPEVIDYVRKKYGHVAQIITFGTHEGQGRHPRRLPRAGRAAGRGGPAGQARAGRAGHDARQGAGDRARAQDRRTTRTI